MDRASTSWRGSRSMKKRYTVSAIAVLFAVAIVTSVAVSPWARGDGTEADPFIAALAAANAELKAGRAGPAFDAFLTMLPQDEGSYLIEGDLTMSKAEVIDWVTRYAEGSAVIVANPEAKVNVLGDGSPDLYQEGKRHLRYGIDAASFTPERYDEMVQLMAAAASAWEAGCKGCGLDFEHDVSLDTAAVAPENSFIVRFRNAGGKFIARAFFPHQLGEERVLTIDPVFYKPTGYEKTGVLTHELGHVLGLRHEHIAGVPGCKTEQGSWIEVTRYDGKSVMHYFCGGGGGKVMKLSACDEVGITLAYTGVVDVERRKICEAA